MLSHLIGDGDIIELRIHNKSVYVSSMQEAQDWMQKHKGAQVMVNPHSIKPQKYLDDKPASSSDILEYRYLAIKSEQVDEIVAWTKPSCYLQSKDMLLVPISGVKRALITRVISSLKLIFSDVKEVTLIPLDTEFINPPDVQVPVSVDWLKSLVADITSESDAEVDALQVISSKTHGVFITHDLYKMGGCPICNSGAAYVGKANGSYFFKCPNGDTWKQLKIGLGLEVSRVEHVSAALRKHGKAALDMPEIQNDLTILKATQEIRKLEVLCHELYIPFAALQAATRKMSALAHEICDTWITDYHLKTDSIDKYSVYIYQDGVYAPAEAHLKTLMDSRFKGLTNESFIENQLSYIRRRTLFEFTDTWLALDNCMLNPETLETEEFSPDVVTRFKLDVAYDPEAEGPGWLQFLKECKTNETLLQETAGYPFIPGYPIHKAVILLGQGGQGKSVFMTVIRTILGTENVSEVPLHSICGDKFASAVMYGKIANFAGDIDSSKLMDSSTFKSACGEDSLLAQRKNKDHFGFVNRAKMVFSCNTLPTTNDQTAGFYRRWVIVDFNRETVTRANTHLAADLLVERSGIFNWMLEGARRLRANQAFTYTASIQEMEKTYDSKAHPIKEFLKDCCRTSTNKNDVITIDHMLEVYNVWRIYNMAPNYSKKAFIKEMQEQTVIRCDVARVQWLYNRTNCFQNISFKSVDTSLPIQVRVAMQKLESVYISKIDYIKLTSNTSGFTRGLRSETIVLYQMTKIIKGVEQEIYVEEYPVLEEARIWRHMPEGWGEGWVDEKPDYINTILYEFPSCPLTGKDTWIAIDVRDWSIKMWFSKPETIYEPDLEFDDYDEMGLHFDKENAQDLM